MDYNSKPEKELITLCLAGDGDAFKALIDLHCPKIKTAMLKSFHNLSPEDFEDCWQNAITSAYTNLSKFRKDAVFETWLFAIFRNEILLNIKHQKKLRKHETHIEDLATHPDFDGSEKFDLVADLDEKLAENASSIVEKREQMDTYKKLIRESLDKLHPNHSKILSMILIDGKSYKETSTELNIPIGTVMTRLFWARKNMQKLLIQAAKTENVELPI